MKRRLENFHTINLNSECRCYVDILLSMGRGRMMQDKLDMSQKVCLAPFRIGKWC